MRGVIMAGGTGSRLRPITTSVNKHLLPIYNKPLIYYPLTTLILAGIREIQIVCNDKDESNFRKLLGDGSQFGCQISYIFQEKAEGIPQGIILSADFIAGESVALILGDNLFHGVGLGRQLARFQNIQGAQLFAYNVSNPQDYGVVEVDASNLAISIEEKPKLPKSNLAVTGLYFYDNSVIERVSKLQPSQRGELEITDLNNAYLHDNQLNVEILSSGTAWLDTGSFENLFDASSYIRALEDRQFLKIGDPFEAAKTRGWI
jgi:glucose-1-phosphate thymidylyltransferase